MDDDFSPVLEEEVMMVEDDVVDDDGIDMYIYILYELCIYTVYIYDDVYIYIYMIIYRYTYGNDDWFRKQIGSYLFGPARVHNCRAVDPLKESLGGSRVPHRKG